MEWWSIEVLDGPGSAGAWWAGYGERLVEAAITHGAQEWHRHDHSWGVLFEVGFSDESDWTRFRGLPLVQAALDAAPDPVNGVLVYRGRGGSAGLAHPRRPRPVPSAGSMALPEPDDELVLELSSSDGPGEPGLPGTLRAGSC